MARKTQKRRGRASKPRSDRRKVGSDPSAARRAGGKTDFGVPERLALSEYARRKSRAAKFQPTTSHPSDPRQEIGAIQEGRRESGVGKSNAGPGAASAGDLDPDIIGVGTGGSGISQSGPDEQVSPAEESTGGSEQFASGPPAVGKNQRRRRGES